MRLSPDGAAKGFWPLGGQGAIDRSSGPRRCCSVQSLIARLHSKLSGDAAAAIHHQQQTRSKDGQNREQGSPSESLFPRIEESALVGVLGSGDRG